VVVCDNEKLAELFKSKKHAKHVSSEKIDHLIWKNDQLAPWLSVLLIFSHVGVLSKLGDKLVAAKHRPENPPRSARERPRGTVL
jgi:hypothetical protein